MTTQRQQSNPTALKETEQNAPGTDAMYETPKEIMARLRKPIEPIRVNKEGDKDWASRAKYKVLSKVSVDLHNGETESHLLGITPINLVFDSDVPPPIKKFSTRNLDFSVAGSEPEITKKKDRQLVVDKHGSILREPGRRRGRSRGKRNMQT